MAVAEHGPIPVRYSNNPKPYFASSLQLLLSRLAAVANRALAESDQDPNSVFADIVDYSQSSEYKVSFSNGSPTVTLVNSQVTSGEDRLARINDR